MGPRTDSLAVVGLACRLPRAANPEAFWRLLRDGAGAIDAMPAGRRDEPDGRGRHPRARHDGFLDQIDPFDPEFFGIAPAEAATMDPRQRLVLELAWEALEDAGVVPGTEPGRGAAVFIGDRGAVADRAASVLGLRGPSATVDAGESSSLVAVHLACENLRKGESRLALAGGVHVEIRSEHAVATAMSGEMPPDEQDVTLDGFTDDPARGEGGGLVVLKPLAAAVADRDRIYCVIRGGAVDHTGEDGTVPAAAQQEVLRLAYQRAGVRPSEVRYVLGGATGIASLIEAALCLAHRQIPASLHCHTPDQPRPLGQLGLGVQQGLRPWPAPDEPLLAGVSAFGSEGTDCHLVLSEVPVPRCQAAPTAPAAPDTSATVVPWTVSGRTLPALRAQAEQLAEYVAARPDLPAADIGLSLCTTRTAFEHRAVVLGARREALLAGLRAVSRGSQAPGLVQGVNRSPDGTVFVFPGNGSQWPGMALDLLDTYPVFAEHLAACGQALAPHVDWALLDVLKGSPEAPALERVDVVQPVLFAVMVSLAELWRWFGVTPDAVIGHSHGEIAAAHVAGALDLADAAAVVALRSRALAGLVERGAMASISLPASEVHGRLDRWQGRLEIAAVNGPGLTVVAGDADAVDDAVALLGGEQVRARRVAIDYASHCGYVEPIRADLLRALSDIAPRPAPTPFYSTVTGGPLDTGVLDAEYWYRNERRPIRFEAAVRAALADGRRAFLEASPHPVLILGLRQILEHAGEADGAVLGTLRRDDGGSERFLTSLAEAHAHGLAVDWRAAFGDRAHRVRLPTYPFQRRRCRPGPGPEGATPDPASPLATRLAGLTTGQQDELLAELVRASVAAVLDCTPSAVGAGQTFKDLGLDSQGIVDLVNRLATASGIALPTAAAFDHPTPRALARQLRARATGACPEAPVEPVPAGSTTADQIAIVSMGCRWPGGADTPERLWQLVIDGVDAIGGFPDNRGWDLAGLYDPEPGRPGKSYVRAGGFLRDADQFDAGFFGISAREAEAMDPQQRLLLEVAWEACERAGIDPSTLAGRPVGVFVGATSQEYGPRLSETADTYAGYALTGTSAAVASGRLAYALGLAGPAITVDTACSSSLVALHLATQALRTGECELALAGGAAVMASPGMFIEFSQLGGLATDGRCKPFSAAADGTGWSEGVGLLLLERLGDAQRLGHPVLALIRGTAVNQGSGGNGLTAPHGPAQERVIRQALANAHLTPDQVDAVEAHSTGTPLGDPIEAQALMSTYGQDRPADRPLLVGSVKSNIGHTQAASGVASVIKMVDALRHGTLPKTLHLTTPTPQVDWAAGNLRLLTEPAAWPETGRPRRAAVSAFGISGTYAHLIVEQAPPAGDPPAGPDAAELAPLPYLLSARSRPALYAQAARLAAHLRAHPDRPVADLAHALATTRTMFDHRAAIIAEHLDDLLSGLDALARGTPAAGLLEGATATHAGQTAYLLAGRGGDRPGRGRDLYRAYPAFAAALDHAAAALDPHLDQPLLGAMFAPPGTPEAARLETAAYAQPALFALQVALHHLLAGFGLRPDYLVGDRAGELTAAHLAGVLTLPDAAALVAAHARLAPDAAGAGGAHLDELRGLARPLTYHAPAIPVVSGVTGEAATTDQLTDPAYWTDRIRGPDRFRSGIVQLGNRRTTSYLELAPYAGPTPLVRDSLADLPDRPDRDPLPMAVLRHDLPETAALLTTLAQVHIHGGRVDWRPALAGGRPRHLDLPTYPFEHRRYWLDAGTHAGGQLTAVPQDAGTGGIVMDLLTAVPAERLEILLAYLRRVVAGVLGSVPERVEVDQPLVALGLHSLKMLELRRCLEAELGPVLGPVPVRLLIEQPTIARFGATVLASIEASFGALWTEVAQLTDEQVDDLLTQPSAEELQP